jgi:hypothetical protein
MLLALMPGLLAAQGNLLRVAPPGKLLAPKNSAVTAKISVQLQNGYHVNSNKPAEEYLIPLRLTWTTTDLATDSISYPAAKMERYAFSEKPLSVFTGDFEIVTRFRVPATAAPGMKIVTGKLRYQACSHKECYPPKTLEVKLPVDIVN